MNGDRNPFGPSSHLTREQMLNYLGHHLSRKEMHEVEKHLVDCQLCSEALEGAKKIQHENRLLSITDDLQKLVRKRKIIRRKIFSAFDILMLLAIFLLLLFLIVVYFVYLKF